ncbi:hypothetical protein A6B38_05965 [Bartonella bacilliformis]|uniref:Uncharacterized protein n=1 Tax=Bartonella bacilliformis INS TaxID=1206782 RepID=A0ABP2SP21_BARBA|nr:hypothetical protein AL467_01260 [Bartonella bacilliformis]EKS45877.1 hypothetical protein BbINS_01151 [Bartonella bacilliformis INS]KZM38059.1 hypothetical protein AWH67_00055 [Bartonella bacilliformis]KZN21345.1 hypothetical protein A6B38_05965 [Bartonella bacilliformis]
MVMTVTVGDGARGVWFFRCFSYNREMQVYRVGLWWWVCTDGGKVKFFRASLNLSKFCKVGEAADYLRR